MSFKSFFILAVFIVLSIPRQGLAQDYVVTLKNGEVLSVAGYSVKGRRLFLAYPLGSAEIDISQVSSIKSGIGDKDLFRDKGVAVTSESPMPESVLSRSGRGQAAGRGRDAFSANPFAAAAFPDEPAFVPDTRISVKPDPRAAEIDAFIDGCTDAVSEKDIDFMFSAFFEDEMEAGTK